MAARSKSYWRQRFQQLEEAQNRKGLECYADIERQYREAQRTIEGQITKWYQRFADNNEISMTEARKMLSGRDLAEFKWTVRDYIKYGEENAVSGQWMKQLENASARYHVSRLEALKLQTQQSIEVLYGNQLDDIDATMKDIYTSGYYHTAYEIQKGAGFGWDFATLDEKTISKVINKPWAADGKNFSSRIWSNKEKLVNELNTTLVQNIMLGQDPQKAIDTIAKKLNTSKYNAGRLVMTEEAYFSSVATKDCYKELDVEEYEILATLDSHTSDICRSLDGKVYKMSEYEAGVTAPPFHVWCRSTTIPYFDDDFGSVGERAARGEDGKTYNVPGDMTYNEWKEKFVDGGDKSELQEVGENDTISLQEKLDSYKTFYMSDQEGYDEWKAAYNDLNSHITDQDKADIKVYTDGSYEAMNAVARYEKGSDAYNKVCEKYGEPNLDAYAEMNQKASEAVSKFKLEDDIMVHRYVSSVDYITGTGSTVDDILNSIGKEYTEKGFSSTCLFEFQTRKFGGKDPIHLQILVGKGSNGAYINDFSEKKDLEFEFLLNQNTKYKIMDGGTRKITLSKYDLKSHKWNEVEQDERYLTLEVLN